jgi:hypothetical protein
MPALKMSDGIQAIDLTGPTCLVNQGTENLKN